MSRARDDDLASRRMLEPPVHDNRRTRSHLRLRGESRIKGLLTRLSGLGDLATCRVIVMDRTICAFDASVPSTERPPRTGRERDFKSRCPPRPRDTGALDHSARLLLLALIRDAVDEKALVHATTIGARADGSRGPPAPPGLLTHLEPRSGSSTTRASQARCRLSQRATRPNWPNPEVRCCARSARVTILMSP